MKKHVFLALAIFSLSSSQAILEKSPTPATKFTMPQLGIRLPHISKKLFIGILFAANASRLIFKHYSAEQKKDNSKSSLILVGRAVVKTTTDHFFFIGHTFEQTGRLINDVLDTQIPTLNEIKTNTKEALNQLGQYRIKIIKKNSDTDSTKSTTSTEIEDSSKN